MGMLVERQNLSRECESVGCNIHRWLESPVYEPDTPVACFRTLNVTSLRRLQGASVGGGGFGQNCMLAEG